MSSPRLETPSGEADPTQLDLAKREGAAYQRALNYMVQEVADNGATQQAGDYIIGIAQEKAEGLYRLEGGDLAWREPEGENCHLEVSVSDVGDHRFIPELEVTATLTAESGEQVGPVRVPFLWHPGLYHYGINLTVPGSGRYAVTVRIEPPSFMRHDRRNGARFARPVEVTFEDFEIKTGHE